MSWIVENWYVLFAFAVVIFAMGMAFEHFIKLPKEEKFKCVKEWLKWAVVEAEKKLGAKTGQLKLRQVYDWAIEKFPWLVNVISFDTFSVWVDEALEWMDKHLESNPVLRHYILGE